MSLRKLAETRIVRDTEVCSGKARIRGTRVTVADILLSLSEGLSHQEILRNNRSLQGDDIKAALAYAFCQADGIILDIRSAFDPELADDANSTMRTHEENKSEDMKRFSEALAEQAAVQEEITKETIAEAKSKKERKTIAPKQVEYAKVAAPIQRPYDLLIDISAEASTKIFKDSDAFEQALEMTVDNYIFEKRSDGQEWLCYSKKYGVEIDQAMKRNLLVTYKDGNEIKKAIFEGYLTTDRLHKIFLARENEITCGKVL